MLPGIPSFRIRAFFQAVACAIPFLSSPFARAGDVAKESRTHSPAGLSARLSAVRGLLRDIEGITVEALDGKIVIDGEVLVRADFDRILRVKDGYPPGLILNLVTLSKIPRAELGKRMQREINRSPSNTYR